jgi:hypothetical protein
MASVEGVIDGPFAGALAAGRSRYNTRFALARMGQPRLRPDVFLDHLRATVGPIVEAVHRQDPARVGPVLDVLYTLSLDLVGRGWMGAEARYPLLGEGWRRLFAEHAALLARAPQRVAEALTNAFYNLSQEPSARPGAWIEGMAALGARVSEEETWLEAGAVLAWRCGLAHYRDGALAACARLKPAAAALALGVEGGLSAAALPPLLAALNEDPWAQPADLLAHPSARKRLRVVGVCGGFRGTGGPFLTPPRVAVLRGGLVAWDRDFLWSLHADAFGAVFRRLGPASMRGDAAAASPLQLAADGTVRGADRGEIFPALAQAASAASTETTLAVTLPDAHFVYLVGLTHEFVR